MLRISAPQGVSLDYTTQQMRRIEQLIQPLRDSGEIVSTFANAGQGGSTNSGFMVMALAPWDERERTPAADRRRDRPGSSREVPGVRAFAGQPNSLGIRGAGSGLQFAIVGNSYAELGDAANKIVAEMEKDPRFQQPRLSTRRDAAAALRRDRPRARLRPRHRHHRPVRARCRRCSTAARSATSSSTTAATR